MLFENVYSWWVKKALAKRADGRSAPPGTGRFGEIPAAEYEVAVFENHFPSLAAKMTAAATPPPRRHRTQPLRGPVGLGPILAEGHASLRDDYRVSCPETDLAAATAQGAGASARG